MKRFVLLFVFLLLPFGFSQDTNSDANAVDVNQVVDLNTGPILLKITFEHTVIGSPADLNAKGWVFSEAKDFAFEADFVSLDRFYVLDFEENEMFVYEPGIVPEGWTPMLSMTNDSGTFRVNNLLGECDGSLFLLFKNEDDSDFSHLEVWEWVTIVADEPTNYYLMFDADQKGICTFSLDLDEVEIGVSVNFREIPSIFEWVEIEGVSCEDNPEHTCIVYPGGESWDFTACLDKDSAVNKEAGVAPDAELCVKGRDAHAAWLLSKVIEQKATALADAAKFKDTGDPETAKAVRDNTIALDSLVESIASGGVSTDQALDEVLAAIAVVAFGILGIFVYSRYSLPFRPITFGKKVQEKFEEAKKNVQEKGEEGRGGGSGSGGSEAGRGEREAGGSEGSQGRRELGGGEEAPGGGNSGSERLGVKDSWW